jgi:hypothetical protein
VKEVAFQMHDVSPCEGATPSIARTRKRGKLLFSSAKALKRSRMRNAESRNRRYTNLRGTIKTLTAEFAKLPVEIVPRPSVEQEDNIPSQSSCELKVHLSVDFRGHHDNQVSLLSNTYFH